VWEVELRCGEVLVGGSGQGRSMGAVAWRGRWPLWGRAGKLRRSGESMQGSAVADQCRAVEGLAQDARP
jgi:hypothetical protein